MPLRSDDKFIVVKTTGGGKQEERPLSELDTYISTGEDSRLTALEAIAQTAKAGTPKTPVASTGSIELNTGISLDFTAKTKGEAGDLITVNLIDPEAENATIDVVVNGNEIDITLASSDVPAITSTAAQVKTAIEATPAAHALIAVAITGLNSTLAVEDSATLSGGVDGIPGVAGAMMYDDTAFYISNGISTVAESNWKAITYDAE